MITYKLNGIDLSSLGIVIEETSGLEIIPKKKGTTAHDYPDENGVVPIITPYSSRDITLRCHMRASSYEIGVGCFVQLQNILKDLFTLDISFYPKILNCDCVREIKPTRINSVSGEVLWQFSLVLREYNPSIQIDR